MRRFFFRYFAVIWLATIGPLRAQTAANFVSMTPCRVIETRDPSFGAFGPPSLAAKSVRDFPVPTSSCNVPAGALAYSFNVTVIPHGSLPYITMWPTGQPQPGASTLNAPSGAVVANAAIVPAGSNGSISVYVAGDTELIVDINGYFAPPTTSPDQLNQQIIQLNQQIAQLSQQLSPLASQVGQIAQLSTQVSQQAAQVSQQFSQFSQQITQVNSVLTDVHSDASKQGVEIGAGTAVSGSQNTGVGYQSLKANTSGTGNVALGAGALSSTVAGSGNIAVGVDAGSNVGDASNSIEIGVSGQATDTNVIRIGNPSIHQNTYVAGINGATVDVGSYVLVDEDGKLGVYTSSLRYKEQVENIDYASDALFALRPVRFRYKQPNKHGEKPIQYGLIAEEVEKIMPELVIHNRQGAVEGVQYHQLPALLLNELQKQHRFIAQQQEQIQTEQRERRQLEARLAALESQTKPHKNESSEPQF